MSQAEIGLIGLGVMGSNLALNIAEKGNKIAVFNRTVEATHKFYAEAGELKGQIVPCDTIEAFDCESSQSTGRYTRYRRSRAALLRRHHCYCHPRSYARTYQPISFT